MRCLEVSFNVFKEQFCRHRCRWTTIELSFKFRSRTVKMSFIGLYGTVVQLLRNFLKAVKLSFNDRCIATKLSFNDHLTVIELSFLLIVIQRSLCCHLTAVQWSFDCSSMIVVRFLYLFHFPTFCIYLTVIIFWKLFSSPDKHDNTFRLTKLTFHFSQHFITVGRHWIFMAINLQTTRTHICTR